MVQAKALRHDINASCAAGYSCQNGSAHCQLVVQEHFQLLIERNGQTDRRRCQKIAQVFSSSVVSFIADPADL